MRLTRLLKILYSVNEYMYKMYVVHVYTNKPQLELMQGTTEICRTSIKRLQLTKETGGVVRTGRRQPVQVARGLYWKEAAFTVSRKLCTVKVENGLSRQEVTCTGYWWPLQVGGSLYRQGGGGEGGCSRQGQAGCIKSGPACQTLTTACHSSATRCQSAGGPIVKPFIYRGNTVQYAMLPNASPTAGNTVQSAMVPNASPTAGTPSSPLWCPMLHPLREYHLIERELWASGRKIGEYITFPVLVIETLIIRITLLTQRQFLTFDICSVPALAAETADKVKISRHSATFSMYSIVP